jgi:sugar phosphate isomerase/epimerase
MISLVGWKRGSADFWQIWLQRVTLPVIPPVAGHGLSPFRIPHLSMPISFSHIAWSHEDESSALVFLKRLGLDMIEVAPLRAFGNPMTASESSVREKAAWYREQGFHVGSFQALIFGTDGLELFGDASARKKLKDTLIAVGRVAGWAGAGPMVFGAPKNRLRGKLSHAEAMKQAAAIFREVGDACADAGSCLVMEANPEAYGSDFCTRLEQAAELVTAVDSQGFGLHVDAGGMALSGEAFEPTLRQFARMIRHVHASQPNLGSFAIPDPVQARIARILRETHYTGSIAIEMRPQPEGLEAVKRAVEAVTTIYQC